jgi:hypothetical protein
MRLSLVLALTLGLGVAGCGGGIPGISGARETGAGQSAAPGSAPAPAPAQAQPSGGSLLSNLFFYGGTTIPPSQDPGFDQPQSAQTCPEVGVIENTAGYRGGTALQQASGVAFQASLVTLARECIFEAKQVRIRVGVEGRLLLGQNGKPGTFSVPVRVVVKRRSDIVVQRFTRLDVTVPATDTLADFVHIEENIVVPISENDPGDEYDIFVGFDPTGQPAARQTRRR